MPGSQDPRFLPGKRIKRDCPLHARNITYRAYAVKGIAGGKAFRAKKPFGELIQSECFSRMMPRRLSAMNARICSTSGYCPANWLTSSSGFPPDTRIINL